MSSPVHLYLITYFDGWDSRSKIGVAANVDVRLAQLQTGNAYELDVFDSFQFPDRPAALTAERKAHELLVAHRMQGEWFSCGADAAWLAIQVVIGKRPMGDLQNALRQLSPEAA